MAFSEILIILPLAFILRSDRRQVLRDSAEEKTKLYYVSVGLALTCTWKSENSVRLKKIRNFHDKFCSG